MSTIFKSCIVVDQSNCADHNIPPKSLNLMHYHWVKDFGYLINPRIPTEGADLKVADIGSGTG